MGSIFTWGEIALALIKIVSAFLDAAQRRQWLNEGEQKAIAKALVEQLRMNGYAKHALEEGASLGDAELDQRLRDFEPPDNK